jgi:uncharacterized protein YbcV (DUF1398 family)
MKNVIAESKNVFTVKQITEKLSQVKTGADFPVLARELKNLGVTYYETRMEDGRSIYHGENDYELVAGSTYEPIIVAENVNVEQLKADIANHQRGKSDYFQISRQSADNGIEKWAVCLITMTCTYIDKAGNKVWVENIPDAPNQKPLFTIEQIKEFHSNVKSGADFPKYIQEIKNLGVTAYETWVKDSHTDYSGGNNFQISSKPMYEGLTISDNIDKEKFKRHLKAHQQGQTDYFTFCKQSAEAGVEKWFVCMNEMTCTYYDKTGRQILMEQIPG